MIPSMLKREVTATGLALTLCTKGAWMVDELGLALLRCICLELCNGTVISS